MKKQQKVIGVDLGGTKVLAGTVDSDQLIETRLQLVPKGGSVDMVMDALYRVIDPIFGEDTSGIGIGVPSVVDVEKGIVYDVQNIPSWESVPLGDLLKSRYGVPVHINNDANCFALGERYFGQGKKFSDFIGLIIGTGIAAGIVIDNKLYNGHNCGAGEFGMIPYLQHNYEYYSSGQFFQNEYGISAKETTMKANKGDTVSLDILAEFGRHLGNAIVAILYALDPPLIILGGSVSQAHPYFQRSMWEQIRKIAYRSIPENLSILCSNQPDIAVLGAAALCLQTSLESIET